MRTFTKIIPIVALSLFTLTTSLEAQAAALSQANRAAGRAWADAVTVDNRATGAGNNLVHPWNRLYYAGMKDGGPRAAAMRQEFRRMLNDVFRQNNQAIAAFRRAQAAYRNLAAVQRRTLTDRKRADFYANQTLKRAAGIENNIRTVQKRSANIRRFWERKLRALRF